MSESIAEFQTITHHSNPKVWTIEDCVTEDEARAIRKFAEKKMKKAVVSGEAGGIESKGRTNSVSWVSHNATPVTTRVANRIAELVGLPLTHAENFQVIRYEAGQEYRPHFDAYDGKTERGLRTMKNGGQRLITVLGYLNDVEAGGGTHFPKLDVEVQAKQGRVVVFENCEKDTNVRTPLSLHAGLPVESGIKWAFNLWFREREFSKSS